MRKDEAVRLLREHAGAIRAIGARSLYLFGSTVRGKARAASDIDLFVDYDEESDSATSAIFCGPRPTSRRATGCIL